MNFLNISSALWERFRDVYDVHQKDGQRLNGLSFADEVPVLLIFDPARVGSQAEDVPNLIRERVVIRSAHALVAATPAQVDCLAPLDGWMRRQFKEGGWTLLFLNGVDTSPLPRGRRQLEEIEQQVRETFDYLGCAFIPSMELLCPDQDHDGQLQYGSAYEYMARNFPHLRTLNEGQEHVPAEGDARDNPNLRIKFEQLSEDGQRLHWSIPSGDGHVRMTGANLRKRMAEHTRARLRPLHGPTPDRSTIHRELHSYASILDVLAKAQAGAISVFSQRPDHIRNYDQNVAKIEDRNPIQVASNPEAYGKRQFGCAMNAVNASRPDELVQPPTMSPEQRFTPAELAVLAFVAVVDPFLICTQHQLYWPEVWAARDLGAKVFARRDVQEADIDAIMELLRSPMPEPEDSLIGDIAIAIHRAIHVFLDL